MTFTAAVVTSPRCHDAMTTGFAFVLRELVARNGLSDADITYVRAGGTANRYRDPLLVANIRDMTPPAKQSYDLSLADRGGLSRDLALDPAGVRTVLQLRSKYGIPQRALSDPTKYIDLSYYDKAFPKR